MSWIDWLVDCVIALGAFGFGLLQLSLSDSFFIPDDFTRLMLGMRNATSVTTATAATLLTCLPLVVRRKLPWVAFSVSLVLWCAFEWPRAVASLSLIGPLVALFTLAYERPRTQSFIAGTCALIAILIDPISANAPRIATLSLVQNIALVVAVTFAGYALHSREQYVVSVKERAEESERLRRTEAEHAISMARAERNAALARIEEQRVEIARELHDITAHSLSAISIQAAAAERTLKVDPDEAARTIASIRQTAKASLDEIRAMVGVLRNSEGEVAETVPTQGTKDVSGYVAYLNSAGISCSFDDEHYERSHVPALVDLAFARILKEATTNIVKHASASKVRIVLSSNSQEATLEITDDGCGMGIAREIDSLDALSQAFRDTGEEGRAHMSNGLRGMFERAHLIGAALTIWEPVSGGLEIKVSAPMANSSEKRSI